MATNTVRFQVDIVLSDKVDLSDEQKDEMAQKIADAILDGVNGKGIAPEEADAFTDIIYVKEWYSYKQAINHTN